MFISKRDDTLLLKLALIGGAVAMVISLSLVVPKVGAVTVQDLMAQIQALQAQLSTMQGSSSSAGACVFTRSLYVGVRGDDVKCLQGQLGVSPMSGRFGPLTKAAVAKWQAANGVSPAAGYFGSISRAKYSSMGGGVVTPGGGGTTGGGGVVTPPAAAGGLSVGLSGSTQAARTIVAGAANMDFGKWDFVAGSAMSLLTR